MGRRHLVVFLFFMSGFTYAHSPALQSSPISLCEAALHSENDLIEAYQYVIGKVGANEILVRELKKVFEAGKKDFNALFTLAETGGIQRGQIQSALNLLRELAGKVKNQSQIKRDLLKYLEQRIRNISQEQSEHNSVVEAQIKVVPSHSLIAEKEDFRFERITVSSHSVEVNAFMQLAYSSASLVTYSFDRIPKTLNWKLATSVEGMNLTELTEYTSSPSMAVGNQLFSSFVMIVRKNLLSLDGKGIIDLPRPFVEPVNRLGSKRLKEPLHLSEIDGFLENTVGISSDGKFVVGVLNGKGWVYSWIKKKGFFGPFFPFDSDPSDGKEISKVAILPESKKALFSDVLGRAYLWDSARPNTTTELPFVLGRHWALAAGTPLLVSADDENRDEIAKKGTVRNLETGEEKTFELKDSSKDVAVSADGQWIAVLGSGVEETWISVRRSSNPEFSIDLRFDRSLSCLKFLPTSHELLVGTSSGRLWKVDVKRALEENGPK